MSQHHSILQPGSDGLHYNSNSINFRISGLSPYNLERLRITLKASSVDTGGLFHIDTLDLYNSRGREVFAERCAHYLKVNQDIVCKALLELIEVLEQERVRLRQQGSGGAAAPVSMSPQEKKEAQGLLRSSGLIERIVDDFDAIGLIGERHNKLLGYIASLSRLLSDPVGVLILSRSGAGKTVLQDAICKFVPPESCIQYTRLTGQSLFYRDEHALRNKVLAIEEEEGMWDAMYSIRTLQSSQRLSIASTRSDAKSGKMAVDEYTVYGPVVVMISTTNPDALDPETRQRFLLLTIDESAQQTRNILQLQRHKSTLSGCKMSMAEQSITRLHHTMQRLLKPLTPIFPDGLRIEYPYKRLQMRREQKKYLSLIKSITLLHQYQRTTGTLQRLDGSSVEYVLVSKQDVALARQLGREVFYRNIDDVSPTGRALLREIAALIAEKQVAVGSERLSDGRDEYTPFTRKELRQRSGWSEAQIRQNIGPLVDLGYLGVLRGRWGSTFRYVLLEEEADEPAERWNEDVDEKSMT